MATAAPTSELPNSAGFGKLPLFSSMLICIVAAFAAAACMSGALIYLARHGKLGLGPAVWAPGSVSAPPPSVTPDEEHLDNVVLEPLLVNLADAGGHSYLRVGIVLAEQKVEAAHAQEAKPGEDPAIRDTLLDALGKKHAAELIAPDAKSDLKKELTTELGTRVPQAHVKTVYFTEFLVQQ